MVQDLIDLFKANAKDDSVRLQGTISKEFINKNGKKTSNESVIAHRRRPRHRRCVWPNAVVSMACNFDNQFSSNFETTDHVPGCSSIAGRCRGASLPRRRDARTAGSGHFGCRPRYSAEVTRFEDACDEAVAHELDATVERVGQLVGDREAEISGRIGSCYAIPHLSEKLRSVSFTIIWTRLRLCGRRSVSTRHSFNRFRTITFGNGSPMSATWWVDCLTI